MGRDIGTRVFPDTPYKFFIDSKTEDHASVESDAFMYPGAGKRSTYEKHHCVTCEWSGFRVLMIDVSETTPMEVWPFVLGDCVLRAMELGVYGRKRRKERVKGLAQ